MSLKILKQQLKEIQAEDEEIVPVPRKEKKKLSLPEAKFTRQRKVMKKNMKPRGPVQVIEDEVSRVKEEVKYAKERKELNRQRNMNFIEAVSRVDGTDIMNRYLVKKGLRTEEKKERVMKKTNAKSYRIESKVSKDSKPKTFSWE